MSPQLIISSANAFNNFNIRTDVSSTNLQSCPAGQWTYCTDTVDLTSLSNIANGFSVVISFSGTNTLTTYVLFSRLKFQAGTIATPFVDDVSLFIQTPSIDSTMLNDGCIARPSLFLSNVVPLGAYQAKSIVDANIATNTILARSLYNGKIITTGNTNSTINVTGIPDTTGMLAGQAISGSGIPAGDTIASVVSGTAITLATAATTSVTGVTLTVVVGSSSVVGCLGYTPENRAGDTCTGVHAHHQDTVVSSTSYQTPAIQIGLTSSTTGTNDGYQPMIGFVRPGACNRTIGLTTTRRFYTTDENGTTGYLLDTVTGVDTNSYQNASITYAKLAQSLINTIAPCGMVICYAGGGPPANWLVCNGQLVLRTGFPALWAAIGTYWGAGDGSTTFAVPNFQGRAPIGYVNIANQGGITARGFGTVGGEENHQLSIAELASHNHGLAADSHNHPFNQSPHSHTYVNPLGALVGIPPGGSGYTGSGGTQTSADNIIANVGAAASGIQIAATGSNIGHNNMMPWAVAYYIIKAV
jgi:microcystin-dependent protein